MRPEHFVSLNKHNFTCDNYYFGNGGKMIGLSRDELILTGITDEELWVHPEIIPHLKLVVSDMKLQGMGIIIKDAWRPRKLYHKIVELRIQKKAPVTELFNLKEMPHSTGKAIDVVPTDLKTGQIIRTRNQPRDGTPCCFVDFYRGKNDPESLAYQKVQDILLRCFLENGFELGSRKEYWHFQLPNIHESAHF